MKNLGVSVLGGCLFLATLVIGSAFAAGDPVKSTRVEISNDPVIEEVIRARNAAPIRKEDMFQDRRAGATWQEFQDFPRRHTPQQMINAMEKSEATDQHGGRGTALGDVFGGTFGSNSFSYSQMLYGDILLGSRSRNLKRKEVNHHEEAADFSAGRGGAGWLD